MSGQVRYETLPDGRRVEVVKVPGPRVSRKRIARGSDLHPELRDEFEVTETYDAAEVAEWADALGREGERGKIDGEVSGAFPRRSRLAAAMIEADLDADALATKAMLPAELIRNLIDSGDVPGDDQRRQLEAVVTDPFPEYGEWIEPSPNELMDGAVSPRTERHRGEPAPTPEEAEARSRRRAQLAAEVRAEAERRRGAAQRREQARRRELDSGLSGIAAKVRRLSDRLGRE